MDFPFDTTRALEFALFRTFCVPSVSALLHRTQEFERCPQRRYDDTDIIISEILEHGYDSERGRAAVRRMNQIHGRFEIANDDFLYVLSTFVFVPIRWNKQFGWRRMIKGERLALFHFWREVGRRMNIRDIPADYAEFKRFNLEYERRNFRFTEANRHVGEATRNLFMSWFPGWMRPLVKHGIHAAMDDPLLDAFGFPRPSPGMRRFVQVIMRSRALLLHWLPKRRSPVLRTEMKTKSYPCGYRIEEIGPRETADAPSRD